MSGIGAVGSYGSSYSPYSVVASGGKLQSAAQDAAGLAIEQKTEAQTRGLDQGTENMKDAVSALNIEDGAMDGITDYIQKIKELAIKSINNTLTEEDKGHIQNQIDEYIKGIDDLANGTTFNEKNLLNGESEDMTINRGGGSTSVAGTYNSTSEKLGLAGFDVTKGDADLSVVDKAMDIVQSSRTSVGAQTKALDFAVNYNNKASMELNGYAMDAEEDRAVGALQDLKKQQALDQYQGMLQNMRQEDEARKTQMFFA